jgi:hypothetical protein
MTVTRLKPRPRTARAATPWPFVLWARRLHLYSGVLFAPAILFFAATGLIQVFDLHKARPATGYQPPALILRLGALHKDQTFALPHQADGDRGREKKVVPKADRVAATRAPRPMSPAQALLKGFAAAAAVGLASTTLLGLYMAYRFGRSARLVSGLLLAGVAIPAVLAALSSH